METPEAASNPAAPLPEKWVARFFTIWTGQAFSLVGSALVQFALVWWMTKTTGSATVLATATLVALLPQIVLGPFAGALVDRWNRRLIMIIADTGIAAATRVLLFLFAAGLAQVWHVYDILLIRSIPHPPRQAAQASGTVEKTSYWQDLRAGLRYVARWPGLLGVMLLTMMLNFLLIPSSSLIPLVISKKVTFPT